MHQEKITILFVISANKTNQKGLCPLNCRITFNKERKQFSTGLFVNPKYWGNKLQKVNTQDSNHKFINAQIEKIEIKIKNIALVLQLQGADCTLDNIYNKYIGVEIKKKEHILSYYKQYLTKIKKLVGLEIKESTYKKFVYVGTHLESFIKWKFKKSDFPLEELNLQFLDYFDYYLKTEKGQEQITINKTIQRLRAPIKQAISEGYLARDPFVLHKSKTVRKVVTFLTTEELQTLEEAVLQQKRLCIIQDLFIFCCYTGLAFTEMTHLEKQNIQVGFDGINWIQMKREKTQRQISIPILPKAQEIIDKYSNEKKLVFPSISNQKFNSYLKEIAEITGIEKRLTHHIARKTFASTVLLFNDVPMEIVSELLGHSNMTITQESYGKIVQKKVSEAMSNLKNKLK
ncbi:site-specific integrase [Flavobacterium sp. GT3R68]|uniref:site-specific integrase n=1 Tax=Flavobacterium sp. GT3R68 TaxID=2594437 RepID=UPI000F885F91|nr:site-specific integrase [Flavobacterium sp. GT3R68]RTY96049.1 site-specific integrase [Flavobacterium sp. GSN2]TRW93822.1 site-specific integrase [Flavobacterium sp. GT3R68]